MGPRSLAATILGAALLAGCAGPSSPPPPRSTDINVSDSGVLTAGARASIDLGYARGAPSAPRNGHAMEIGFSRGSGDGSQAISASQRPVVFANQTFNPPQQLAYDFDYTFVEAAYRFRYFANDVFGLELLGGVANADLDLTVTGATQRASDSISSPGAVAGLGVIFRLRPTTSVQARGSYFYSGDEEGVTRATRFELHLAQALWRNAGIRAGYASWNIDSVRDDVWRNLSPVSVKYRGPALGLDLMF